MKMLRKITDAKTLKIVKKTSKVEFTSVKVTTLQCTDCTSTTNRLSPQFIFGKCSENKLS